MFQEKNLGCALAILSSLVNRFASVVNQVRDSLVQYEISNFGLLIAQNYHRMQDLVAFSTKVMCVA